MSVALLDTTELAEVGPARARVARILREDLPLTLRVRHAAVYLESPAGPRLLAATDLAPGAHRRGEVLKLPVGSFATLVLSREGPPWSQGEIERARTAAQMVKRAMGSYGTTGWEI